MDIEIVSPDADIVCAQLAEVDGFRFECWGERAGRRLPGTVRVRDLAELDEELAMAGLQAIPTIANDALRRDRSRPGTVYASSVISVS